MTEQAPLRIGPSEIPGLSPIMSHIVKTYHRAYSIVGEEPNIAQVFSTAMSRHLPPQYRRHILPQGEWGMGKSTLLKTVLKPFWSDVRLYTRITGPGLDRSTESLDGKILFIEQILQTEPMQLSFLMSEGELAILAVEVDPETKRKVSKETRLKGMPVVMSTLTGGQVETQFLSRVSTLRVDESKEQTGRITEKKLENWSKRHTGDPSLIAGPLSWIDRKCRELGPHVREIKAPWASKLKAGENIPNVPSMRRGLDKIANLVNAIAFVKAALNLRSAVVHEITKGVREFYIIAEPEDMSDAVFILGSDQLIESVSYFFGKSKAVYNVLPSEGEGWTSRQVATALGMSQNRAREYLNSLVDLNHAARGEKVRGQYYYVKVPESEPAINLSVTMNAEEMGSWYRDNFPEPEAKLVEPTPDIEIVGYPSKPESSTIERIVPDSPTIQPIVPQVTPNEAPHDHGNYIAHQTCAICQQLAGVRPDKSGTFLVCNPCFEAQP